MDSISSRSSTSSESSSRYARQSVVQPLSSSQRGALNELKHLCRTKSVYWNVTKIDGTRIIAPNNDDITLQRYLRARDYDPQAAFKQYSTTVAWRRKIQLDDMYSNVEVSHFEAMRRLMPQWTGRRTRRGVPVFVYSVSKTRPEDLVSTSKKDPSLCSVFLPAEYSTQFVQPLCARMHPDRAMPCSVFVIDLHGVGMKHFWNLRAHLQRASTMATSHYPESVEKIFILGAPSFFPMIWGYINKWFEPALTAKISVLAASDIKSVLTRHIDIDDLPALYGGNLDWDYGMHPNLDEEAMGIVGHLADGWIEGPLRYVEDEEGDEIVTLGMHGKAHRGRVLAKLASERSFSDSESEGY